LIAAISELIENPDLQIRLGEAARRHVSSALSLEIFYSSLGSLLSEISNIPNPTTVLTNNNT